MLKRGEESTTMCYTSFVDKSIFDPYKCRLLTIQIFNKTKLITPIGSVPVHEVDLSALYALPAERLFHSL